MEKHPDVAESAGVYEAARNKRMAAGLREQEAYGAVLLLMQKHKLTKWKDPDSDLLVELVPEAVKLKVRRMKDADEEE